MHILQLSVFPSVSDSIQSLLQENKIPDRFCPLCASVQVATLKRSFSPCSQYLVQLKIFFGQGDFLVKNAQVVKCGNEFLSLTKVSN